MIGPSYAWQARSQLATFVERGATGRRRFGALIGEILARWLVAEPIDSLLEDARATLAEPLAHRRPYFVPFRGLKAAAMAAVLGAPVEPPLRAAADALDAAQANAMDPRERSNVAGWGVALAAWLGDAELRTRWIRERAALPPARSEAETAILALALQPAIEPGMLAAWPGLAPMLAIEALMMGDDHQILLATALLASGENAATLARERERVDSDLWPTDAYRARADFAPAVWSVHGDALHATIEITGHGGPIWAIAPFMRPVFSVVDKLDAFARGEFQRSDVHGVRSKAHLEALLASPDARIEIRYHAIPAALLDVDSVAAYQFVVAAISRWMSLRHGDRFRAQLALLVA